MRVPALKLLGLGMALSALSGGRAQPVPAAPAVTVLPPANTLMLTQTIQTVFVTVTNFARFTNAGVEMLVLTDTVPLLDDGRVPDAAAGDGTFSGGLLVPAFPTATNFTVRFTTIGEDLSVTNDAGEPLPESWATNVTSITYLAAIRPPNDNFANAIKIGPAGGVVFGTNTGASIEPAEPFHGYDPHVAASVWWAWSPTDNARVLIDTAGSSFDPVLAVYTGTTLENLKPVAWSTNDVYHGLKANVVFDAKAGVTYRIAVAGYDADGVGSIRLSIAPGGAPDDVGPLVTIMSPGGESLFTTNDVSFVGNAKDPEPNATGVALVTLQLNDDLPVPANGTTNWNLTLTLPPGTNVIRAIATDLAGNQGAPFVVVVRYVPALNDDFGEALVLADLAGTITGDSRQATVEPGEPPHAGNEGGHSLWYYYVAPASGSLLLSTEGSTFDTLLAVYEGPSLTNLTLVAANDDATPDSGYSRLTATVLRGHVYHIAIDGFGGATGFVTLQYTFTTTEVLYRLNLLASLGGTVSPPAGLYAEGSTQVVTALPARDYRFLGWQGSLNLAQNPLTLVMTQNYTLSAAFQVTSYTEGFESGGFNPSLPWTSQGNMPWTVLSNVVYAGRFAARSGAISDGQRSVLLLPVILIAGTGTFWVRVSSETGWDALEFYVNRVFQRNWSGDVNWQERQFPVVDGLNTLEWRYVKDANFSSGLDAAFVDNLYLPLPDQAVAARLAIASLNPGPCQIAVQGYPGRAYIIESSLDLAGWTSVCTNSSPSGSWVWTDPNPSSAPARFCRAILQ